MIYTEDILTLDLFKHILFWMETMANKQYSVIFYFCVNKLLSKIEKVPRGIRGEKSSKDMASSRNLVSTIGA